MSWPFSFQGLLRDFSSCLPPQYRQRRPSRVRRRYLVGLIDQFSQLRRRVVTGDAAVLVAQQGPPVFLGNTRCPEPSPEGVLQVVNTDRGESLRCRSQEAFLVLLRRPDPCLLPGRIVHAMNRRRLAVPVGHPIREYPDRIQAALPLDGRLGHRVQHDQPFLSILHARSLVPASKIRRNQEDAGIEFRYRDLPVPPQLDHLLLPRAAVDLVERHSPQVVRQFREQQRLLFPRKRVGRSPRSLLVQLADHRYRVQPGSFLFVTPFPGAQVENADDPLQGDVHRPWVTPGFTLPVDVLPGFSLSLMYGASDSSSTCMSGRLPM